ncbi:hypothetical protein KW429_11925 [Vibrio fluvialis]|nr:hypothetical protein [Vibrio fluvialis]
MTNQVNASELTFFSATPKTLSSKVKGSKRPEQLKVPFSNLVVIEGWNIRKEIDQDHVKNMMVSFVNGQEPSDFMVQPVEMNGAVRLAILGGHHTHETISNIIAIQQGGEPKNDFEKMIKEGVQFTNDTLCTVKLIKAANEAERIIQAYNHNQTLGMGYLDKARSFQTLRSEGLTVTQISHHLGVRKSVVSNALYLLNGDAELLDLVEKKKISGTAAMHLLREHGPEKATHYAKASIGIFESVTTELTGGDILDVTADNDEQLQLPELESATQLSAATVESNQEPTQAELSRSAAKIHRRTPKKKDDLTPSEKQQLYSLYLMLADKSSTLDLPDAVQHEVDKMVTTIKEKNLVTQS